ncbi:Na/Pi symporter [Marinoscillum furvescens]|uniref:Sodium-dependent phosphate cotransporter n=1 Tax=Marinoscillum furvescens DSM 4134 TaxID=1122208 RepID=A0A3D9LH86_MARFU|nr:Na/Pi symporter [Marinoscillum furvescens]REE05854.1 sodium-dependent phosphate cotransporter [Marinoscillum furvescens DSM 4134]
MKTNWGKHIFAIAVAILSFFMSIQLLGAGLQEIGKGLSGVFELTLSNPSIGLFIGLLLTAILQSSSTTTSMAVAAVAAGSLTLENAIPLIMGANIGTTLTSTVVSMSYVTKVAEFRKAISAGCVHDIFNVLVCLVLFPLEVKYGLLSEVSHSIASSLYIASGNAPAVESFFFYKLFEEFGAQLISWTGPYLVIFIAVVLLFSTVKYISNMLYKRLIGDARNRFEQVAFKNSFKSFSWGFVLTSAIQSSSLTTSLIVPLVATGKVNLKRAFEFVMGANLGTTITALLAALLKSEAAISLAIAHFLFNSVGVLLFIAVPFLNKIPMYLADRLGAVSLRYKITAFAYILVLFFILPFTLIYFSQSKSEKQENTVRRSQVELFSNN